MKEDEYAMFEDMLATADIKINGNRPWDIKIHDIAVFD